MMKISRPEAFVIEKNCRRNINQMAIKAAELGARFRPHFKTHQSIPVGRWFRDAGVSGITVSTPEMASYFMDDGWDDITLGFPFYAEQIESIQHLAKTCRFRLFIQHAEDVRLIAERIRYPISVMIEIDAGYNRSGIPLDELAEIQSIVDESKHHAHIDFHGFYIHDGGTYNVQGAGAVESVFDRTAEAFNELQNRYPEAALCAGDTPSSSLLNDHLNAADELSPGNLVFYDLMQFQIGSCSFNDIGLLVKAPVAQKKYRNDTCIIHGGAVHFSKDRLEAAEGITFGQPVTIDDQGHIEKIEGTSLTALSQEHGTVQGLSRLQEAYGTDSLDSIWICPVHSCLTANLFKEYILFESGKRIEKRILS